MASGIFEKWLLKKNSFFLDLDLGGKGLKNGAVPNSALLSHPKEFRGFFLEHFLHSLKLHPSHFETHIFNPNQIIVLFSFHQVILLTDKTELWMLLSDLFPIFCGVRKNTNEQNTHLQKEQQNYKTKLQYAMKQ